MVFITAREWRVASLAFMRTFSPIRRFREKITAVTASLLARRLLASSEGAEGKRLASGPTARVNSPLAQLPL